jgi:hypothetical protein
MSQGNKISEERFSYSMDIMKALLRISYEIIDVRGTSSAFDEVFGRICQSAGRNFVNLFERGMISDQQSPSGAASSQESAGACRDTNDQMLIEALSRVCVGMSDLGRTLDAAKRHRSMEAEGVSQTNNTLSQVWFRGVEKCYEDAVNNFEDLKTSKLYNRS